MCLYNSHTLLLVELFDRVWDNFKWKAKRFGKFTKMEVPTMKKSFFCLSLQNGGLVLAWFVQIASFLGMIAIIVLMSVGVESMLENNLAPNVKRVSSDSKPYFINFWLFIKSYIILPLTVLYVALTIYLLISIATFIVSFLLIRAINTVNTHNIWIWRCRINFIFL